MKGFSRVLLAAALCLGFLPRSGGAEVVVLHPGESYTAGELTVTCAPNGATPSTVLSRKECQVWDSFGEKCLFERTIKSFAGIECVEECQHWDDFSDTCRFQTSCEFHPGQRVFLKTVCDEFDRFSATCRRTRQVVIREQTLK